MGKVVTSQGLTEFVQAGTFEKVEPGKPPKDAPPLEVKAEPPVKDIGETKPEIKTEVKAEESPKVEPKAEDEGLEPEDADFPERVRKRINAKHKAMREAQEAAEEAERFSENQYNRARLAEERATQLEQQNKELQAKLTPPKEETKKPEIKDFTDAQGQVDWDKYTDAKADYAAKVAVAEERARQASERAQEESAKIAEKIKASVEAAKKAHSDFDEVMKGHDEPLPQHVLNYLAESEQTGELGYYLAKNPADLERISKLKPILAIAELGKLETKLAKPLQSETKSPAANGASAPSIAERGGAPPPITPLSGSGSGTVVTDPAKMDYKQLREYERRRAVEARKRH